MKFYTKEDEDGIWMIITKNKHQQLRNNLNFTNEKDDKKISKKEM